MPLAVEVPKIALTLGAIVAGTVVPHEDGNDTVSVVLTLPPAGAAAALPTTLTVAADAQRQFQFASRLPPGDYRISAYRKTGDNHLQHAMAIQRNSRPLRIEPGQDRVEARIELQD